MIKAHDLIVVPRVGVELGRSLKFRALVEAPLRARVVGYENESSQDELFGAGLALSLGVAGAF
ncbi:MAG: hypothetical protein SFX73_32240 [Kofleriaceae bacterium]|nr:hypothetical protein [Kofleriaceae bacterium]